ncbi:MAG: SAM-dependent methyltransferase [Coprococcus sp.]
MKEIHDAGARKASELLEKGKNLVFLTIGDPTVYSTGIYIYKRLKKMGYQGKIFSGIPSFCALRQQGWRSRLWRTGRSCMFFRCPMELKKS